MSYTILIGAAVLDWDADEVSARVEVTVEKVELDDAPCFPGDEMTGRSNARYPGYGQWHEFTQAAGLERFFFHPETGLMREHPGTVHLRGADLAIVEQALGAWQKAHPGTQPAFCDCTREGCGSHAGNPRQRHFDGDGILVRLLWLKFWIGWALAHARTPAICNR